MVAAIHVNVLSTYLADWGMKTRFISQVKDPTARIKGYDKIFRAISTGERDINTLLRLIDERLRILERRHFPTIENIKDFDFTADIEVVVLLKALYVQIRTYLDVVSGVIRYFHKKNNLPMSFNKLLNKLGKTVIPDDLSQVLSSAQVWFKEFKEVRDDLVHRYEDFLLLFSGKENEIVIHHASFSKTKANMAFDYGSIKSFIGKLLKNIQILIDDLLDYFDKKFFDWYGFVQSSVSRNKTIFDGGYMLYWAHKYGGYNHTALRIQEDQIRVDDVTHSP